MLAENRSKVALEKEKIRKDYDLMSSQLSEILKNNELANSFVQVSFTQILSPLILLKNIFIINVCSLQL